MIFDTHAHYDDQVFDEDRDELLCSMAARGIGTIVNIGADMETSAATVALTERYPFLYGAVGVHPSETGGLTEDDMEQLKRYAARPKIVAIGEIGLDYHDPDTNREAQQRWFVRQLALAREVRLPVVIHSRDAADDTMRIMKEQKCEEIGGVIHCFSYSKELALQYVKMGFYIGVGGVLTFANAKKLVEAVKAVPLEKIVLETDAPYLSPAPERGVRNHSGKLTLVSEKLAALKGVTVQELIRITEENARRLYRMGQET
ncbi:MAG: TatD family hydrolase [bacterium]|nr:TatD family hydrolase [bacterium]